MHFVKYAVYCGCSPGMKTLMIHGVREDYFDLKLAEYSLTFDDGLFSQYYYYPLFRRYRSELIYFIATAFVKPRKARPWFDGNPLGFVKSKQYMHAAFVQNRFDHFMAIEELQALAGEKVAIGAHSHGHDVIVTRMGPRKKKKPSAWKLARFQNHPAISEEKYHIRSKLAFQGYCLKSGKLSRRSESEWEDYIKYDTEQCLKWFDAHLNLKPELYGLPFNEYSDKLLAILKSFGFKKFYGARPVEEKDIYGRMDIDRLANLPDARAADDSFPSLL